MNDLARNLAQWTRRSTRAAAAELSRLSQLTRSVRVIDDLELAREAAILKAFDPWRKQIVEEITG
jgi:hypothetical protein